MLLLEAGGANEDRNLRVDGQRWITFMNKDMNWGYKTSPQEHCDNRELDYSRGKGLGGSSAINFGVYTVGARDDYEEWARIVGDDDFRWDKIQARRDARHNEIREELRAGKHEATFVEFDVDEPNSPFLQVFTPGGMEEMGMDMNPQIGRAHV